VALAGGAFLALSVLFRPTAASLHTARLVVTPADQSQPAVAVAISEEGIA